VSRADSRVVLSLTLLAAGFSSAWGATDFSPYATVGIRHDSNVFMRPSGQPAFAAFGDTTFGDTVENYIAGMDAGFDLGQDRLGLTAEATRDNYSHFSQLDHYEYRLRANLDWRLGPVVDGALTYSESHYMEPFTDTLSEQLLLDTERTTGLMVRVLLNPRWRLDLNPELHELDSPLPGFPGFRLHEQEDSATLDYLGFGKLTSGLQFGYIHGQYEQIIEATRYDQSTVGLTSDYKVTGLSTFGTDVGYSKRTTEPNPAGSITEPAGSPIAAAYAGYTGAIGKISSFTGTLRYRREITGKTSANLSLFRRLDSYAAGANPEVSTGGELGLEWKPDVRFVVEARYRMAHESIQGGLLLAGVTNRSDRRNSADFAVSYTAFNWLTIRSYASWDKTTSSFALGNYSDTMVGIEFTGRIRYP
jgi:hypothetical protein